MVNIQIVRGVIEMEIHRLAELKERLLGIERFDEVFDQCTKVFGDPHKAWEWLDGPNYALGYVRPVDVMMKPDGAQQVLDLLLRIQWGIPS